MEQGLRFKLELESQTTAKMQALADHIHEEYGESFRYIAILGDGSCLPSALSEGGLRLRKKSYVGTANELRAEVVRHAKGNPDIELDNERHPFSSMLDLGVTIPQWCAQHSKEAEYCGIEFIMSVPSGYQPGIRVMSLPLDGGVN